MPATPQERTLNARLAAHALHAQGGTNTGPARKEFLARFERQVDPDGVLTESERARRAEHAKKEYMLRLALKSAQARRKSGGAE